MNNLAPVFAAIGGLLYLIPMVVKPILTGDHRFGPVEFVILFFATIFIILAVVVHVKSGGEIRGWRKDNPAQNWSGITFLVCLAGGLIIGQWLEYLEGSRQRRFGPTGIAAVVISLLIWLALYLLLWRPRHPGGKS